MQFIKEIVIESLSETLALINMEDTPINRAFVIAESDLSLKKMVRRLPLKKKLAAFLYIRELHKYAKELDILIFK